MHPAVRVDYCNHILPYSGMAVGLTDPEIYPASGWNMFCYSRGPQKSGLGNPVRGKIEKNPKPCRRRLVPQVLYLENPLNSFTVTAGMKNREDTCQVWIVNNRSGGTWIGVVPPAYSMKFAPYPT